MDRIDMFPVTRGFIGLGGSVELYPDGGGIWAARAYDTHTVWVVLAPRAGETCAALLDRLERTLARCLIGGQCVAEAHAEEARAA
jgi:hypothetical protein